MASQTLPSLERQSFPQVLNSAIELEIRRVPTARTNFVHCYWSDEFCHCREMAVVHDLKSEQEFCSRHFRMVEVRRG
jgi:hypothetical protein